MTYIIAIGICVVIIFVAACVMYKHSVHKQFIEGYWDASQTFCDRSGIESAQVYFQSEKAYIIIDEGDRVILNKCVDVALSPMLCDDCRWTITFSEPVDPLPQSCELRLDVGRGMIGLFENETLYLELFKNSKATAGVV